MTDKLDDRALDRLFKTARTRNAWTEQPVTEHQVRELYDLMKFGPTSGNCCSERFVWVRSVEGKCRLAALAAPTNEPKILAAPVTVIVGYDLDFAEQLPRLFLARGKHMQASYSDPVVAQTTAFRNGSLQGSYLIIAAQALGLDCGPMSGFHNEAVDSTGEVLGQYSAGGRTEAASAIAAARKAFEVGGVAADGGSVDVNEPYGEKLFARVAGGIRSDTRTAVEAAAKPLTNTRWVNVSSARDRRESNLARRIARGRIEFGGHVAEWIIVLFLLGTFWAAVTPTLCLAQVQLPSVNLGDTNFEDAFGGPGWLLQEFPEAYVAGELKDSHGNTIPGSNRVTAYSTTTHVAFVTKKRVLGGWLSGEVLQPFVDLEVQLANGTSSRVRGLADLTIGSGLQWAPKRIGEGVFAHRFVLDVGLPTGKYSDQRPINIGNHFVVVNPYYALTYERKKVEFSVRLHYLWNSTNNDPFLGFGIRDMQPGEAFHVNYATSYELLKNVRLGFNGYWLQQLTDQKIDDTDIPSSRERTVGLGPGIQLRGRDMWFRLNGYMETDVHNRPSGIRVTFRISKTVPTKEPQP